MKRAPPPNFKDLTGLKFGKLLVLNREGSIVSKSGVNSVWKCQCECGKITHVSSGNINTTKSCGCLKREGVIRHYSKRSKESYKYTTARVLYTNYKNRANKKKIEFEITFEYFKTLIFNNCYYCGRTETQTVNHKNFLRIIKYNGIDRKDSKIGYTIDNSVTCCKTCNYGKSNTEYNDWLNYLSDLVKFRSNL